MDKKELIRKAFEARDFAYAPYSKFRVGAALLGKNQEIYTGCNIENAAYGDTLCAERTAFVKAVSVGVKEFEAIAIVGGPSEGIHNFAYPCGMCRQVMAEFCDSKTFLIIIAQSEDVYEEYTLGQLLPKGFEPKQLEF